MWEVLSHTTNNYRGPILDHGLGNVNQGALNPATRLQLGVTFPVVRRYSARLENLVRNTLRYQPNDRLTLAELKVGIDRYKVLIGPSLIRIDPNLRQVNDGDLFDIGQHVDSDR